MATPLLEVTMRFVVKTDLTEEKSRVPPVIMRSSRISPSSPYLRMPGSPVVATSESATFMDSAENPSVPLTAVNMNPILYVSVFFFPRSFPFFFFFFEKKLTDFLSEIDHLCRRIFYFKMDCQTSLLPYNLLGRLCCFCRLLW